MQSTAGYWGARMQLHNFTTDTPYTTSFTEGFALKMHSRCKGVKELPNVLGCNVYQVHQVCAVQFGSSSTPFECYANFFDASQSLCELERRMKWCEEAIWGVKNKFFRKCIRMGLGLHPSTPWTF